MQTTSSSLKDEVEELIRDAKVVPVHKTTSLGDTSRWRISFLAKSLLMKGPFSEKSGLLAFVTCSGTSALTFTAHK